MKTRFFPLLLVVMAIVLCIAGIVFLSKSGGPETDQDAREPLMVSGIVCIAFGSGLAVTGCVLGSQRKD